MLLSLKSQATLFTKFLRKGRRESVYLGSSTVQHLYLNRQSECCRSTFEYFYLHLEGEINTKSIFQFLFFT